MSDELDRLNNLISEFRELHSNTPTFHSPQRRYYQRVIEDLECVRAENERLRRELDVVGYTARHDAALARAQQAERERDEARAALVRLKTLSTQLADHLAGKDGGCMVSMGAAIDRELADLPKPAAPTDAEIPEQLRDVWTCKIGWADRSALPRGSDGPMRAAVRRAFRELTGRDAKFVFSGWNGVLTEPELAVVEDRLPTPPPDEARAEVERLRKERDQARAALTAVRDFVSRNLQGSPVFVRAVVIASDVVEEIDRLLAAAPQPGTATEPAKPQWQPIETAPKDGTFVLLCEEYGDVTIGWLSQRTKRWHLFCIGMDEGVDECGSPTHWMPLPEAPTQQEEPNE